MKNEMVKTGCLVIGFSLAFLTACGDRRSNAEFNTDSTNRQIDTSRMQEDSLIGDTTLGNLDGTGSTRYPNTEGYEKSGLENNKPE